MPHTFQEWEHEPETQPASSRRGGPPGNVVGVDVLDPLQPPARPSGGAFLLVRVLAAMVLIALAAALFLLLRPR